MLTDMNGLRLVDPTTNIFSYTIAISEKENLFVRIQMIDHYLEKTDDNLLVVVPTKWVICKGEDIFAKSSCLFVPEAFIREQMEAQGIHDPSHKFVEEFTFVSAQEGIAFFTEFLKTKQQNNEN